MASEYHNAEWSQAHNKRPIKVSMADLRRRRNRRKSNALWRMVVSAMDHDEEPLEGSHNRGPRSKGPKHA